LETVYWLKNNFCGKDNITYDAIISFKEIYLKVNIHTAKVGWCELSFEHCVMTVWLHSPPLMNGVLLKGFRYSGRFPTLQPLRIAAFFLNLYPAKYPSNPCT